MSDLTQSEQHPDADQLNAFVEHALPLHEREQTLAHLAICDHCRAVVALSLPPLEESPAPQPTPTRRPWFASWHLAWPAAAAFATLAFVIIHLHNTPPSPQKIAVPTEVAASHPPAALSVPQPSPAIVSKPRSEPAAKTPPPNEPIDIPTANRTYTTPTPAVTSMSAVATQEADNGSAVPQVQAAANAVAPPLNSAAAPVLSAPDTPPQTVGGVLNGFAMNPNGAGTGLLINGRNILPLTSLPSHRPALSTAVNGHKILAIDTQNTLFYSEDNGKNWTTIPTQWRGRAVQVNLARPTIKVQNSAIANDGNANGSSIPQSPPIANATLAGTITDQSGAIVVGTSITITNPSNKTSRTVTSDITGHYFADNLTPGSYQLEASAPGFQTQQLAVNIAATQQNQTNLTLQIGAVTQTVTIEAAQVAPLATTSRSLATPRAALKRAAPAKPAAIPLFEITTDDGNHWTSSEGKIWTQE